MKKVLIYLVCGIILLSVVGCSNQEKSVLYRYDIEDIDYNADSYKAYSIGYNATISGYKTSVLSRYEFNNDGNCNYYGSYKNDTGTTSVSVDSNCKYTITDNKISITIDSMKQIYTPSASASAMGYKGETSYEKDLKMEAELSEKGKVMIMGNLNYHHVSYLNYLEKSMSNVLIDPETNKEYKSDGTPAGNSDPDYVRENSIDLSKYQIIDK